MVRTRRGGSGAQAPGGNGNGSIGNDRGRGIAVRGQNGAYQQGRPSGDERSNANQNNRFRDDQYHSNQFFRQGDHSRNGCSRNNAPCDGPKRRRRSRSPRPYRGGGGCDSQYRNHRDSYHPAPPTKLPPPPPSLPPPPVTAPSYSQYPPPPGLDAFRPPQGVFSFRAAKPSCVQESYSSYRSNEEGRNLNQTPNTGPTGRGPNSRFNNRYNPGGKSAKCWRPRRPFYASERELLNQNHYDGTEQTFFDPNAAATFRPLEDLSDEDATMEMSDEDVNSGPKKKRLRTGDATSNSKDMHRWSNPEPYTAVPPTELSTLQKKRDVVQLIRKARVQSDQARAAAPEEAEDFIALDADETEDEEQDTRPAPCDSPGVARNIRFPAVSRISSEGASWPREMNSSAFTHIDLQSSSDLGSRKRTRDDRVKPFSELPAHAKPKRANMRPVNGFIADEWKTVPGENSCPWHTEDHSDSPSMGIWLHKEIVDFYEYVRPRPFEERIRNQIIDELKQFTRSMYQNAEVYPFGSVPTGLYLPTGDMDFALLSDQYQRGGPRMVELTKSRALWRLKSALLQRQAAYMSDVEVITRAKVPLVKYVEIKTGLRMDISFENKAGLEAVRTFKAWKDQYPVMPILVTCVKHFLAMRGLNEPVNGGIGGFSVICLVVSLLQHMPEVKSPNMGSELHLDELLMKFFDFYGNKFDYRRVAISLNPPRYINKSDVRDLVYKNPDRLSIIDPNRPDNDISGGSSNSSRILEIFGEAHHDLNWRMREIAHMESPGKASILEVIFAGNYRSFKEQRELMRTLDEEGLIQPFPGSHRPVHW